MSDGGKYQTDGNERIGLIVLCIVGMLLVLGVIMVVASLILPPSP